MSGRSAFFTSQDPDCLRVSIAKTKHRDKKASTHFISPTYNPELVTCGSRPHGGGRRSDILHMDIYITIYDSSKMTAMK